MKITRWDPFSDVDEFFGRLGRGGFGRWPRAFEEGGQMIEWSPAADIVETEKEYLVKAELPGVKREDVTVSVEGGALIIKGERKQEKEEKGEKRHRVERSYGAFYRTFGLPGNAADSDIHADFNDGVLNVHIPKLKVEKPKAVQIEVK